MGWNPFKEVKRAVSSVTDDIFRNPLEWGADVATFGGTKAVRDAKDKIIEGMLPKLPAAPELATEEAASEQLADDANLENQITGRRGRASTILSGPQGLSGSTQYSARKTLLGA